MVGVDVRERDRADAASTLLGKGDGSVQGEAGRVAGVDQHEPAATDEVGADRLAGDAARGGHDDPGHVVGDLVDLDRPEGTGREVLADVVERRRERELLERRARRHPQDDPPVGHRGEGVARAEPLVRGDLAALERRHRAAGQGRREEPRVEASRARDRGDPARERHEQVGPEA